VSTACGLNAWKPRITAITAHTAVIGRSNGNVRYRKRLNAPAPSSLAAS
jgi:hypothetical protein